MFSVGLIAAVALMFWHSRRFREYRSAEDGFSVKYPVRWDIKEDQVGAAVIFVSPLENKLDVFRENVNVVIQNFSPHPVTLEEYTQIAIDQMKFTLRDNMTILESSSFYLGDEDGRKFVYLGKGDGTELKFMHVWTVIDSKAYQITFAALASQFDKYLPQAEKMIQSFEFNRE